MSRREEVDKIPAQLWWLERPVCLEWREEEGETPSLFRWLAELIREIYCGLDTRVRDLARTRERIG